MLDWKPIKGFEGYYEVSNNGDIRSCERLVNHSGGGLARKKPRPMARMVSNSGYRYCILNKEGKAYHVQIHRAVAIAFIPNPDGKEQVNHINADKLDNRVENLEWCTAEENMQHAYKNNLIDLNKTKHVGLSNGSAKSVELYDPTTGETIKRYTLMSDAANELDLSLGKICYCCKGHIKSTKGFHFRYC